MKIVYDSQIFQQQRYGGISRYFVEISQRIGKMRGMTTTIVAPRHKNAYLAAMPAGAMAGWRERSRGDITQRRVERLIEQKLVSLWQPHVIHETYFWGCRLQADRAVRILTIFDMIHERFSGMFPAGDPTSNAKRAAAARADHIICISESTRKDVIEILEIPESKLSVTHLAASMMHSHSGQKKEAERQFTDPYVLYVGQRAGYKNFALLLQALQLSADLRRIPLVCFGGGDFSAAEWAAVDASGMDRRQVRVLHGDDDVLAALYADAGCFVYPSLYEGFGIPPLEAMQCGCPVICSNTSSIPEVVGDAAILFDPLEADALGGALEKVMGSSSVRERLRDRGYARVQGFSWDRCAEETAAIYRRN